ncbi:LCP family protein [Liquorilactobacillus cacaonum]|uniref:LytR family transcriptional regulator n=1 Tax=Liquorilactobacillus cacaonum DSM 21116 TaxID=1423729 RepID=A0A0R2CME6_9LACO|nr:LCP family protein [Liquorilactobacillus cacaonum]KRM91124.1 LytR family transcriptional regulator [Liquorilactobacillus cacaonum DSM 21116]
MSEQKKHKSSKSIKKRKKIIWSIVVAIVVIAVVGAAVGYKVYNDTKSAANATYKKVKSDSAGKTTKDKSKIAENKAFSILLVGTDAKSGLSTSANADAILVVTVNPSTGKTTFASLPRYAKVKISGQNTEGQLTTAYNAGGMSTMISTVKSYLDTPIDYYMEVNVRGLQELTSLFGSVKVDNDQKFSNMGYTFAQGTVSLDKSSVLAFAKNSESVDDSQKHQREVLAGLLKEIASVKGASRYQDILSALSSNMKTDVTFDEMKLLAKNYGSDSNVQQLQLESTQKEVSGTQYDVVSQSNLDTFTTALKDSLK